MRRFRFRSVSVPAPGPGIHCSTSTNAVLAAAAAVMDWLWILMPKLLSWMLCRHGSHDRCTIVPIACSLTRSFGHRFGCEFPSGSPDEYADMWWSEDELRLCAPLGFFGASVADNHVGPERG